MILTVGFIVVTGIAMTTYLMENVANFTGELLAANVEAMAKDDEEDQPKDYEGKYLKEYNTSGIVTENGRSYLVTYRVYETVLCVGKGTVRCSVGDTLSVEISRTELSSTR